MRGMLERGYDNYTCTHQCCTYLATYFAACSDHYCRSNERGMHQHGHLGFWLWWLLNLRGRWYQPQLLQQ